METATIARIVNATPHYAIPQQNDIPLLGERFFGPHGMDCDKLGTDNADWRKATRKVGGRTMSADTLGDAKDSRVAELATRWEKLVKSNPSLIEGDGEGVASLVVDGEDYSHLNPQSDGDARYFEIRQGTLSNAPQNNYGGSRDVGDGV